MTKPEASSLFLALQALDGSVKGDEGLRRINEYCREWTHGERSKEWPSPKRWDDRTHELFLFLCELGDACDPEGNSLFRVIIRGRKNNPTPRNVRAMTTLKKVGAALKFDELVRSGAAKKQAHFQVQEETGVSKAEQLKARTLPLYKILGGEG